jgi:transcriptional regulator with XRE-family HTH domain
MDKEAPSTPGAAETSNTLSLGEAITRAIGDRSRRALAREMSMAASSTISRWEQGKIVPRLSDLAKLEEELGMRRGWIATAAGYVEPATDVTSAIDADPDLDEAGRKVMHAAYESTVAHCRAARQLASAEHHGDDRP